MKPPAIAYSLLGVALAIATLVTLSRSSFFPFQTSDSAWLRNWLTFSVCLTPACCCRSTNQQQAAHRERQRSVADLAFHLAHVTCLITIDLRDCSEHIWLTSSVPFATSGSPQGPGSDEQQCCPVHSSSVLHGRGTYSTDPVQATGS
jgi:hypothetical protein